MLSLRDISKAYRALPNFLRGQLLGLGALIAGTSLGVIFAVYGASQESAVSIVSGFSVYLLSLFFIHALWRRFSLNFVLFAMEQRVRYYPFLPYASLIKRGYLHLNRVATQIEAQRNSIRMLGRALFFLVSIVPLLGMSESFASPSAVAISFLGFLTLLKFSPADRLFFRGIFPISALQILSEYFRLFPLAITLGVEAYMERRVLQRLREEKKSLRRMFFTSVFHLRTFWVGLAIPALALLGLKDLGFGKSLLSLSLGGALAGSVYFWRRFFLEAKRVKLFVRYRDRRQRSHRSIKRNDGFPHTLNLENSWGDPLVLKPGECVAVEGVSISWQMRLRDSLLFRRRSYRALPRGLCGSLECASRYLTDVSLRENLVFDNPLRLSDQQIWNCIEIVGWYPQIRAWGGLSAILTPQHFSLEDNIRLSLCRHLLMGVPFVTLEGNGVERSLSIDFCKSILRAAAYFDVGVLLLGFTPEFIARLQNGGGVTSIVRIAPPYSSGAESAML